MMLQLIYKLIKRLFQKYKCPDFTKNIFEISIPT